MADEFTWQDDKRALIMPLLGGPKSPVAHSLVGELFDQVVRPRMAGKQARPTSIEKGQRALGALLGDLCRYRAQRRDGKHGMAPKDFSTEELGFGRTSFLLVRDALLAADLIRFSRGWNFTSEGFDGAMVRHGGRLAMFRLAPNLVDRLGELCGPDARTHWSHGRPKVRADEPLVSLRARKVGKEEADELPYSLTESGVDAIVGGVEKLNRFLAGRVEGIAFGGVRRVYNDGDMPGKRWKRGGRYYSRLGAEQYEMMGEIARVKTIILDGEIVHELDIRASHLTVLHGVLGLPFDPGHSDPYACGNVHREAVKAFLTASLGRGNLRANRWYPRSIESYAEKRPGRKLVEDYKVEEVRSAVLARYPFLSKLEELGFNSLDLQWHEAEILTLALHRLMERNIPSLPVHDALLVPESKLEEGKVALRRAFASYFPLGNVIPALEVTYGGPYAGAINI